MKKMTLNAIAVMLLASLSTFSNAAVPDSSPAAHGGHQHGVDHKRKLERFEERGQQHEPSLARRRLASRPCLGAKTKVSRKSKV